MWFRSVDFSQPLVEAHREGSLVLFVGAGASMAPPSCLPDFNTLANEIAERARVEPLESEHNQPDVLLGRLADQHQVDVHQQVADRLGSPSSKPNRLHQAIATLAAAGPKVRIVTTNYDLHLTAALRCLNKGFQEHKGPALPMGNDFGGLVYLHGNLVQCPRRLVITDSDFGSAYLREAWASRFLERMFGEYTVLFVGYSHSDMMMQYIARALGRGNDRRFVLTRNQSSSDQPRSVRDKWKRFGLRPIHYEVVNGSHGKLTEAIERWSGFASMGLTAHRERLRDLVSRSPSHIPEENSYLEDTVMDPKRVQFFVEFAKGEEWLKWATDQPLFKQLFNPEAMSGDTAEALSDWLKSHDTGSERLSDWVTIVEALGDWFAAEYALKEDLSSDAMGIVSAAGGQLSRQLWMALDRRLLGVSERRDEWLRPWLVLLIEKAPDIELRSLSYILEALRWPTDRAVALLLFDCLTEPRQMFLSSGIRQRCFRGYEFALSEAWKELFEPDLSEAAAEVIVIVDRHLRRAHQLITIANPCEPDWDPISFGRSAIEEHSQDEMRRDVDVLIDAARDCLEALVDSGNTGGPLYLQTWADSNIPILRRLAVHGWTHRNDVDGTKKIGWLLPREWLFDHELWHETFQLIREALPSADHSMVDELVEQIQVGFSDVADEKIRAYKKFQVLWWITHHAPELESARTGFARIQAENPEWEIDGHPDFTHWHEAGVVHPQQPMSVPELHDLVTVDAALAVERVRLYEQRTSVWDGPTWNDALSVLADTIREYPDHGFLVLAAPGGDHPDIVRYVVRGWKDSTLDSETADKIADRLLQSELTPVAEEVSRLLTDGGEVWHRSPVARLLARKLLETLEEQGSG